MKKIINLIGICFLVFMTITSNVKAQVDSTEIKYNQLYKKNIKKPRINGVYIPKDLDDVYKELSELSSSNALTKFKSASENDASTKLALGLGRWMFVNWNFYEGSRISHYIKTKYGISHPEDMSKFLIICFHRHMNKSVIEPNQVAEKISGDRIKLLIDKKIIRVKKEKNG